MPLERIPAEWRAWLIENAGRGCDASDLIRGLVNGEILSHASAREAVRQAFAASGRTIVKTDRPQPHFEGNTRCLEGQVLRLVAETASPRVVIIDDFLSADECAQVIVSGRHALAAIDVVDPHDGSHVRHRDRRGEYTTFTRGQTALIARIEQRIALLVDWPVDHGEGFQLIHYATGDEYRPHYDWFDPALSGSAVHLKNGGQRIATLIVYLNEPEAGGGTGFPKVAGLTVQARPGRAVYFDNLDEKLAIDSRALHSGEPVTAGEKWIATKWLRLSAH